MANLKQSTAFESDQVPTQPESIEPENLQAQTLSRVMSANNTAFYKRDSQGINQWSSQADLNQASPEPRLKTAHRASRHEGSSSNNLNRT